MKNININFLFPFMGLIILIFALSEQMFSVPPLGTLLNPFIGAVQNEDDQSLNTSGIIPSAMGLSDSVHIFFDNRKVPHIYAKNDTDLYFAQGYVTACLRLWQMDFMSYAAAGRLSEIFRDGFLDYDRNQRRLGILHAAEASLQTVAQDPETRKAVNAYTKGVNAYINQLDYKKMPFEYKLLDYKPEPWTNLKTILIMKSVGNTLSGYEEDFSMTNLMLALGEEKFNMLYPDFTPHITPIVNDPVHKTNPSLAYTSKPAYLDYFFLTSGTVISESVYNPKLGSNSWAVSGDKTWSGAPILCSDPHLNLSLPSIWLEMQLSSPSMNVYGVSIPGTPAVIIGFNKDVAWGITNGADDVKDWYKLKITPDYRKYEYDGKWLDLNYVIEEIKRREQKPFYDTVYYTIHGPIVNSKSYSRHQESINYALKWELLRPSNEFLSFIRLNKARNFTDYKEAIRHNSCPVLNFTFAGNDNTIAISHQGNMAVKWPGQGRFVLDGTKSNHLATEYIPADRLPQEVNPSCHYVLSANQHPTATNYAYYYNGYYTETRANRIRQLLERENKFDIAKMEAIQLDNTNSFAIDALPVLMKNIEKDKLDDPQNKALERLKTWKGVYESGDENAKLFDLWWKNIRDYTWDEFKAFSFYVRVPQDYVLLDLISKDPNNEYFDRQGTSARENAAIILRESFVDAFTVYDKLQKGKTIKWGELNKVNLMHLTNMSAFSRTGLPSAGCPDAINSMSSGWGPSWRMIVELGKRPRAVGVYAGGQSGNIGSPYYDQFVTAWNKGHYFPLEFYMSMEEAEMQTLIHWILPSFHIHH